MEQTRYIRGWGTGQVSCCTNGHAAMITSEPKPRGCGAGLALLPHTITQSQQNITVSCHFRAFPSAHSDDQRAARPHSRVQRFDRPIKVSLRRGDARVGGNGERLRPGPERRVSGSLTASRRSPPAARVIAVFPLRSRMHSRRVVRGRDTAKNSNLNTLSIPQVTTVSDNAGCHRLRAPARPHRDCALRARRRAPLDAPSLAPWLRFPSRPCVKATC